MVIEILGSLLFVAIVVIVGLVMHFRSNAAKWIATNNRLFETLKECDVELEKLTNLQLQSKEKLAEVAEIHKEIQMVMATTPSIPKSVKTHVLGLIAK